MTRRRPGLAALLVAVLAAPAFSAGAEVKSANALYLLKCSGCHRADGVGAADAGVPPFPGFVGGLARDATGRNYMLHVPGVAASGLGDSDLARVLNFLVDKWGGEPPAQAFTSAEVAKLRTNAVDDIVAYRRTLVARLRRAGAPIADYPWP